MNNYSDMIEKRIREKRKSLIQNDKNYNKNSKNIKANKELITAVEEKLNETKQGIKQSYSIKKRGDFLNWVENWQISDNPLLEELDKRSLQMWIDEKGKFVLKNIDLQVENTILKNDISFKISSLIGKRCFIGSWKDDTDNKVAPNEIISIHSKDYRPDIKKRFFQINKNYIYNTFTPTEYMNCTIPPKKEPTTILKLIKHLVNYDDKKFNYFINWLAYYWATFKRPLTAIVFKGEQGAGKGIFAENIIIPLFGKKQVALINNEMIENKFKANLFEYKSFYIFEEVSKGNSKSNKEVKSFLKEIITNGSYQMDRKREASVEVKIQAPSLFFTNEAKFLEIEPSDRRFNVFLTGGALHKNNFLDFGSYENLTYHIKRELADFASYLYNYQIDPQIVNIPLDTPEKRAVISVTNSLYSNFLTALKNRDLEYFEDLKQINKPLYSEIEEAFLTGKLKRPIIGNIFNTLFYKELPAQKIVSELKAIDPTFFDNTKTIKGSKYIDLF